MSTVVDLLAELDPVGRDERGGWTRPGLDHADRALRRWFVRRAEELGLAVERDANGNVWAWWGTPGPDAVVTGSHLDSVPGGGRLDGPLGVVSALVAVGRLRAAGFQPARPIAVAVLAEEEGSRFGVACLGSRLLTGAIGAERALALTDGDGASLADALRADGVDPRRTGRDDAALGRIGVFVELHVEQGRALADLDAPIGLATGILAHGRWRMTVTGRGDHAGTTRMADRADPVVAAARVALAVEEAALTADGARATVGRIEAVPGGTNVIASCVELTLDVRAADSARTRALVARIEEAAALAAARNGCGFGIEEQSFSAEVVFDARLRARLDEVLGGVPALPTGAGHDAGILAAHVPAAMLFVRNPTGVSHAPGEGAADADLDAGVDALESVLRSLAGSADPQFLHNTPPAIVAERRVAEELRIRQSFWAQFVVTPAGKRVGVRFAVVDGRIASIEEHTGPEAGDTHLESVVPGFVNAHSHAFHRNLRGRAEGDDFWQWRDAMYRLANRLEPDSYRGVAASVFREMAAAGWTAVGEFHYVHHRRDGAPYDPPHAMELALADAARDVGIRLVLLDTCYLTADVGGAPLEPEQRRFGDGDADRYLDRWQALRSAIGDDPLVTLGAALHSVRAVSLDAMARVGAGLPADVPLHLHVAEQPRENADFLAVHGVTQVTALDRLGILSPRTALVHGTHLSAEDVSTVGAAGATVVFCPTTEADLADGIGPARALADAGARIALGSDGQTVIDPLLELRGLEAGERLASGRRGRFAPAELLAAATANGSASLGLTPNLFEVGDPADFVELAMDSPRTSGVDRDRTFASATAADVLRTVVAGRIVHGG